jgi:rhodanese-related sulfurtransferase
MSDTISPTDLQTKLHNTAVQLLDVRRKNDLDSEPALIPGAEWHDPAAANTWADELRSDKEVIIYCARGGSVSKSTLEMLRAKGLTVQYVEGGLAGWKENGGEVIPG